MESENRIPDRRVSGGIFYGRGVRYTGSQNSKYHQIDIFWSIQIMVKGASMTIVYNVVSHKSKGVMFKMIH